MLSGGTKCEGGRVCEVGPWDAFTLLVEQKSANMHIRYYVKISSALFAVDLFILAKTLKIDHVLNYE